MQARHRGQVIIGRQGPHPIDVCLRALAAYVLVRATKDATSSDPREQADALAWLNSDEGRAMARALGVFWKQPLTAVDLQRRERNVYMRGG